MKKFLLITFAVFTIIGTAVASENIIVKEYHHATDSGNVAEKLIALINDYTKKINAVESVYDLFFISEKCYKDKMAFEKNNAEEIKAFNNTLNQEEQAAYSEAIKTAMAQFEAAVNRKAEALANEQNTAK